jgi:hypothetical protein
MAWPATTSRSRRGRAWRAPGPRRTACPPVRAGTREQDGDLAALGEAATAAEQGDGPRTLSHLRRVSRWVLTAAAGAGAEVATAAIKAALGLA